MAITKEQIEELLEQGLTQAAIGRKFNISRQRIGQILNPEKYKEARRKYQQSEKYKEAQRKYQQSEKYKEYQRKYQQSEKYKEAQRKYYQTVIKPKKFNQK